MNGKHHGMNHECWTDGKHGMSKIRAKIWYRAVRKGAAHAAEYDVLTAP